MKEENTKPPESGTLYVVSTPIGNREDMTLRALRILKSVDLIAAEGVKHTSGLCRHFGIKTKLTRYNQHNQQTKGPQFLKKLKSGSDIALVTNAGTPGVSDPGGVLIRQAMEEGIKVSPIPGPSALLAALSVSGLRTTERILFLGFLPNRPGKRRKELENLKSEPATMVIFESPHRVQSMLRDLKDILGDREIVVSRELTKKYEEVTRGSINRILSHLGSKEIRGEFTLVVAGKDKGTDEESLNQETRNTIEDWLRQRDMSVREIALRLSETEGLPYRRLYKECLSMKKDLGCL
ncbi:MAG: 16S rRNA (cytidine(1402)-2'-O)-methyltransferase [Deltaproteobacteria bacterium]|nr:16S rRNA (cytidine(1402)-2'-O)-methyltransferase [Deltaproteobacteria bacterium]